MTPIISRRLLLAGTASFLAMPALAADLRQVTDPRGTVEVPADPARIVVTDGDEILQAVLCLGLKPVGSTRPDLTGGFSRWVAEAMPQDVGYIGSSEEPNYEAVLMMEPDLILMSEDDTGDLEATLDRYRQIAPTVLFEIRPYLWRDLFLKVADATNRMAEAEAVLQRFDARVAEVRAKLGDNAGTATVARIRSKDVRYMVQDTSFLWSVLKAVGYTAPPAQEHDGEHFIDVSLERLDLLDADLILLLEDGGAMGAGGMTERLEALPTFAALTGEKVKLPAADFLFGNILTAFGILDFIEARIPA